MRMRMPIGSSQDLGESLWHRRTPPRATPNYDFWAHHLHRYEEPEGLRQVVVHGAMRHEGYHARRQEHQKWDLDPQWQSGDAQLPRGWRDLPRDDERFSVLWDRDGHKG